MFTAHIVTNGNMEMHILDTVEIRFGNSFTIQEHLNRIVREYELGGVSLVLTDSASSMRCAISMTSFERAACCVHLLNLICSDAISRCPSVVSLLEHLSRITGIFICCVSFLYLETFIYSLSISLHKHNRMGKKSCCTKVFLG